MIQNITFQSFDTLSRHAVDQTHLGFEIVFRLGRGLFRCKSLPAVIQYCFRQKMRRFIIAAPFFRLAKDRFIPVFDEAIIILSAVKAGLFAHFPFILFLIHLLAAYLKGATI